MLAGDFSEWPYPIYDPATSRVVNGTIVRDQFMGCNGTTPNVICATDPRLVASLAPRWNKPFPPGNRPGLANKWEAPAGVVGRPGGRAAPPVLPRQGPLRIDFPLPRHPAVYPACSSRAAR